MTLKHFILAASLVALPATTVLAQTTTYGERHDINGRRATEQARIHQGERSGQLTHREARNLEAHQRAIHQQEHADRLANGGNLNPQERHQLAREQNRQSARIYNQKHDEQTRPGVEPR